MSEHNKGHGPGKVAPFTQSPGSGKGSNWPTPSSPNTKGFPKPSKGHSAPKPK